MEDQPISGVARGGNLSSEVSIPSPVGPRAAPLRNGPLATRGLIGSDAHDSDGRHIGYVEELIVDPRAGHIEYVVIRAERHGEPRASLVSVPWRGVRVDRVRQLCAVAVEAWALRAALSLPASSWPLLSDPAWAEEVHAHFVGRTGAA